MESDEEEVCDARRGMLIISLSLHFPVRHVACQERHVAFKQLT